MLSEAQKQTLIRIAREAIAARVAGLPGTSHDISEQFPDASGVFVTIKRRGDLRGCLGTLQCRAPLADEIARCAGDSATEDPRFPPVSMGEVPDLSVEISVLGPLEEIDPTKPGAIEIGTHGLVVEQGLRRGLLLPQVATEWGWDVEQFLQHTSRKAGLPLDAWRTARVYRFDAEVFGEHA
jgi:AmmeMemoRadiSam system protein A